MGFLELNWLMSIQRQRRRLRIQDRNCSAASLAKRKRLPCQQGDDSPFGKRMKRPALYLPEEIWRHIHSLMPLRDAARAACVSHAFLESWRCHPNLILSKEGLGLSKKACKKDIKGRDFISKVDHILKNHSGIGVKTFTLEVYDYVNTCVLNNWLEIAIKPGIEELTLDLPLEYKAECYNFPCSLLHDGFGNKIWSLHLSRCTFGPTVRLGCLRTFSLFQVHITGDELGCLLSNSFALETLVIMYCNAIGCLKIPALLQQLSCLEVLNCKKLQVIESKAPNLSSFKFSGGLIKLSLGEALQMKDMSCLPQSNILHYARLKLPSMVPNLEILKLCSASERVNTPIVPVKFLHLKSLDICLATIEGPFSPAYDYLSLVSFLDASPALETFKLTVEQTRMKHDSVVGDSSDLRQMPGHRYDKIKNVKISGFCSAKSMVELTCDILDNAKSLEYLTLDTIVDCDENIDRCSDHKIGECDPVGRHMLMEAHNALLAVRRFISSKVPSTVKFTVLKPCSRCHAFEDIHPMFDYVLDNGSTTSRTL